MRYLPLPDDVAIAVYNAIKNSLDTPPAGTTPAPGTGPAPTTGGAYVLPPAAPVKAQSEDDFSRALRGQKPLTAEGHAREDWKWTHGKDIVAMLVASGVAGAVLEKQNLILDHQAATYDLATGFPTKTLAESIDHARKNTWDNAGRYFPDGFGTVTVNRDEAGWKAPPGDPAYSGPY